MPGHVHDISTIAMRLFESMDDYNVASDASRFGPA